MYQFILHQKKILFNVFYKYIGRLFRFIYLQSYKRGKKPNFIASFCLNSHLLKGFSFCSKHYSFSLTYYDFLCYMCLLCRTGEIGSLRSVNASMLLYSVLFALLDEVKKNEMQNRRLFFSFLQLVVSYICILNNN
jgi:hypothetical protein